MPVSITSVTPTPESESLHPSIDITLNIQYREKFLAPLSIKGIISGEDNRTLGNIFEVSLKNGNSFSIQALHYTQQSNIRDLSITKVFRLTLDQKALDHIEHLREKNKKGDVIIRLDLSMLVLEGRAEIGGYAIERLQIPILNQQGNTVRQADLLRIDGSNPDLHNTHTRMMIPSQDLSYLNLREETMTLTNIIKGSDWVNDFQPQLGIGKFLIMEIPEVININEPKDEIEERLHSASKHLLEISELVKKGEWEEVAEDCRAVYEDLRKNFKEKFDSLVQKLLRDDNGISDKGIADFMKMIDGHNGFIHEFHHTRGEDGKVKKIVVHKEDAYALYITLIGLVNILTTKYHRLKKFDSKI